MKVKFSSRANREVRQVLEYYAREADVEVAEDFYNDLRAAIRRVKQWPLAFPLIGPDVHRAVLRRFPFQVVYKIESSNVIRVFAIRHHKQATDAEYEIE